MKFSAIVYFLLFSSILLISIICGTGCAQIGAPTGGSKDTIPPHLINASPDLKSTHFSGNKITLTFDEYVDVQNVQTNLLVSPFPKTNPVVAFKLKTVTVKLKDSLLPNTTYAINFGDAIRDNNEGNPIKNFTYIFSTGDTIDSLELSGNVILAETGKTDSSLLALLYRNANDSSVQKNKPDYIAKLNGDGAFTFTNLPAGIYRLYALKDGDGSKTYNSKIEEFAFADSDITISASTMPVTLYAFAEEKDIKKISTPVIGKSISKQEKKLKFTTLLSGMDQDLLTSLEIIFNKPLKDLDPQKIILTDTLFQNIPGTEVTPDSSRKKILIKTKWKEDTYYDLILQKDAVSDSSDTQLAKTDTLFFKTKKESDYGSLLLRFPNAEISQHPVLQFIQGEEIVKSIPITASQWSDKLFIPGEYGLRILYDTNNNGKWDTGNYSKKQQPEKVVSLDKKLVVKAGWDNERDVGPL